MRPIRTALVGLMLALLAAGCELPRHEDVAPPVESPAASTRFPGPAGESDTSEPEVFNLEPATEPHDTAAIAVYFSRTHDGDDEAAERDPESIDRRAAAFIASADRTIDAAFFEIESDRIVDALLAAQARGVRVRIVAESDYLGNPEALRLARAGAAIVPDERSALMHNKFIVVDGEAVWTGSYNLTDNCSWRNDNNAVVVRSRELAENYTAELEEMFVDRDFGPRSPSATPHTLVRVGGASISNYFAPEDEVAPKVRRIARVAKRTIRVLAFSFTDTLLADELIARHAAGVDVRVVLERRGATARGSVLPRLRAAGLDVRTDGNPWVMHDKVIVVDGTWTVTGSYNFTTSAERSNDENVLIIKSPEVAERYEQEFARIFDAAPGVTAAL